MSEEGHMSTVQASIEDKLNAKLSPLYLEVLNESHMHNVPANSETHFKVTIVSDDFVEKRLIQRHRAVNELLSDELAGPVHALALHTYTADDWNKSRVCHQTHQIAWVEVKSNTSLVFAYDISEPFSRIKLLTIR